MRLEKRCLIISECVYVLFSDRKRQKVTAERSNHVHGKDCEEEDRMERDNKTNKLQIS
jgi:hypothetical protein